MPPSPLIIEDSRQVRRPLKKGILEGVIKGVATEAIIKVMSEVIDHKEAVMPLISA